MAKRHATRSKSTPRRMASTTTSRDDPLQMLIEQIQSASSVDRDRAAIRVRDFSEAVVNALWRSIKKRANINRRGTMVRALQVFDCGDRFDDLFKLVIHGNYEVQCHALRILQRQSFSVTHAQIRSARKQLKALRPRKHFTADDLDSLRPLLEAVLERLHATLTRGSLWEGAACASRRWRMCRWR
jgi:hypothetical protein